MKKQLLLSAFLVLFVQTAVFAGEVKVNIDPNQLTEVPNAVLLQENLAGGGVPTARGLGQAAEQGIRTVIDLRNPEEGTAQEKDYIDGIGLNYVNIPVSVESFSESQADKLNAVLKDPKTGPALLHCATGQRAAAVWALQRNRYEGISAEQAFSEAKAKGLKKPELEAKLKSLLK